MTTNHCYSYYTYDSNMMLSYLFMYMPNIDYMCYYHKRFSGLFLTATECFLRNPDLDDLGTESEKQMSSKLASASVGFNRIVD